MIHFLKFEIYFSIALTSLFLIGCDDKNDTPSESIKVNEFISDTMSDYYYWNEQIPKSGLNKASDPNDYFESLLYKPVDKWSFITDDYEGLMAHLSGTFTTNGMEFILSYTDNSKTKIFGIVEYCEKNSPAHNAGIQRGDLIYKINGEQLDVNNYQRLLMLPDYTLTLATRSINGDFTPLSPSINLNSIELDVDPVFLTKVFNYNGIKTGYLIYNSFIGDEDDAHLKSAFQYFKDNGVTELIIDLRYNSGGLVSSANLMCSMVLPASYSGQIMFNYTYNEDFTNYLKINEPDYLESQKQRIVATPTNLSLQRVFVLTTENTASASELVIYGLKSFINVVQIGSQTTGKYYASTTFQKEDEYTNWAIQPLFARLESKAQGIDYTQGLIPNIVKDDDLFTPLGDESELLLNTALNQIYGSYPTKALKKGRIANLQQLVGSKMKLHPEKFRMLIKNPIK